MADTIGSMTYWNIEYRVMANAHLTDGGPSSDSQIA